MPLLGNARIHILSATRFLASEGSGDTDEDFNHHEEVFVMTYRQLSPEERYMLAALRRQGLNQSEIARALGRHRSTVCREVRRNSTRADGRYRASTAQERTNGRRSRSRRNQRFSAEDFALIDELLRRQWSPEQVAGHLARTGRLSISHETIYRHVWRDKKEAGCSTPTCAAPARGGASATGLRQPRPTGRKAPDLGAPAEVETREQSGTGRPTP
jgi:IS30 family transposase